MDFLGDFTMRGLELVSTVFIFVIGLTALAVIFMFIVDATQSKDAIRHNYPVVGRFRDLFTRLGEFFRQYFFALDREEMPFNRAERDWIYRSAKGGNNTLPFGSTRNLSLVGCPIFINCAFPHLDEQAHNPPPVTFGPYTPNPYQAGSIINASAMSYGSLSKPAIQALSHGAALAGCYLNTGEGGLAPYHLEGGCDIVFQMGTAKYGCCTDAGLLNEEKLAKIAAHGQVKMIEVKLSQGAKPGKGGILPAAFPKGKRRFRRTAIQRSVMSMNCLISSNVCAAFQNSPQVLKRCSALMAGSMNFATQSNGAASNSPQILSR